jgi:hypothetical protein
VEATLLSKLAEQGVVAIVLALSLVANFFLFKEIKDVQEKRIKEAIETRNSMLEPLKAIQNTVQLILDGVSRSKR